jgi:sigma-B regulation protein RsbU (phosphoserine phosphatase)
MDRLHDVLNSEQLRSAADTLDMVNSDMEKFSNGAEQSDDVTMLEFVYNGDENADFIINAEVKQCPRFMHFVEQDMQQKRVNVNIRESVLVAAEEIFANVAMYAYEQCGYLRVSTFCKNGKYTIVFKDRGQPFDPLKATDPDITLNASERKVGGLGIFMVKKVAHKVEYAYENGQNILQVSFA